MRILKSGVIISQKSGGLQERWRCREMRKVDLPRCRITSSTSILFRHVGGTRSNCEEILFRGAYGSMPPCRRPGAMDTVENYKAAHLIDQLVGTRRISPETY